MSCEGCIFSWVENPTLPSDSQYCQACKRNPKRSREFERKVAEKYKLKPPFDLYLTLDSLNIIIEKIQENLFNKSSR